MSMSAAGIVLIAPGNRVLYMLRDDGGGWGIPGGKVEQGETFIQAAVRETFEETGLQIDPETLRAVSVQQNADGFEFAAFAARVPLEFIPRLTEHTAAVWATPAEAPARRRAATVRDPVTVACPVTVAFISLMAP